MVNKNPLLSIVIPTKNRHQYLQILILALVEFENNDFEIIIHDNSEDNLTFLKFINDCDSSKIKYFYNADNLDAIANCNLAFSKATGKYLCFIGDDDGITPELLEFVNWMDENGIESASFNFANYQWPDIRYKYYNDRLSGRLEFENENRIIEKIEVKKEYEKLLKIGAQNFLKAPKTYQGVVAKSCLDNLYNTYATYFPGPVPDMSNSIGLINYINSHVYCNLPFIISGQSKNSMSGRGAMKEHKGKIIDENSLPSETFTNWSIKIPKYWSATTIWAESALKALKNTNNNILEKKFNYSFFYSKCLVFDIEYFNKIFNSFYNGFTVKEKILILIPLPFYICLINFYRFKTHFERIINYKKNKIIISKVENIHFAIKMISDRLKFN